MYIDQLDILKATDGGLDIILYYYPQAKLTLESSRKEFKIRNEKTASARLKQLKDGNWIVTDFGGDNVSRNGVQICQFEEDIDFREAVVLLGGRYGVGGITKEANKAGFDKLQAKPDQKEGHYDFDVKKELEPHELKELGPRVTKEICERYHVFALNSFTQIKNRHALISSSNENYPIYLFDHQEWQKIYQPRNPEKQYRFRYVGTKPKDWINGLDQVRKAYEKHISNIQDDPDYDREKNPEPKLPEVILCSGDRDALNVASMGYAVIWLNSETASLSGGDYKEIMKYTEVLYNLPDIDKTGVRQAIKLGLKFLDIRTIWLPPKLRTYKDARGNPRKDLRDFVEIWPKNESFRKLVKVAIPMKFWDEEVTDKGIKYYFNNVYAYHFLWANGFQVLEDLNSKDGYALIRIENNQVREIKPKQVRGFMDKFLEQRYYPIQLRNMILKTAQMTETSLMNLPEADIDFTDFDKESQYLFFSNRTWKVSAKEIIEYRPVDVDRSVWEKEVVPHKVKKLETPIKITYNPESKEFDIDILDYSSMFMRFLINTSRVHWQQELEVRLEEKDAKFTEKYRKQNRWRLDGSLLSEREIWEQKQHLINKIFAVGYLLHRYKNPARPWCVFAMDNKMDELGKSNGRSGKSLLFRALRFFMNSETLSGKNKKLTDNNHIYDRVTEHTDFILIDDADQYMDFGFFFDAITGDLIVNPKNNKSYEIPFAKAPKFCITSNFTLRNIDPSTEGRILYTVFSDFYHYKTANDSEYQETLTVNDDFGKNLFDDYTEEEWNADINFFAECIRFFLQVKSPIKIQPPMDMVTLRNLRTEMGEGFKDWADLYFSAADGLADHVDTLVSKDKAFEDFKIKTGSYKWTKNRFTRSLKAWCKFTHYVWALDPEQFKNAQKRIQRREDGVVVDMIYVQTKELSAADYIDADLKEEDKPF